MKVFLYIVAINSKGLAYKQGLEMLLSCNNGIATVALQTSLQSQILVLLISKKVGGARIPRALAMPSDEN